MSNHQRDVDPDQVGYIIGTSGTDTFQFVSTTGLMPGRLEYIVLRDFPDQLDGQPRHVEVLAQVTRIGVASRLLSDDLNYDETIAILTGHFSDRPRVVLDARIIGYLDPRGNVRRPRFAAAPGHPVRRASDEVLRQFFCYDIRDGIRAGHLLDRPDVDVQLNPNGLRRHLAIIAQTGAGKSYLSGRIVECLLELGGTVLAIDPNSDYVLLRKAHADAERPYATAAHTSFADRVDLYRIPGLEHYRYNDALVGPSQPYRVRFSDLTLYDLLDLAGVDEKYVRISAAVRVALQDLKNTGAAYRPEDLVRQLRRRARVRPAPADEPAEDELLAEAPPDGAAPPAEGAVDARDGARAPHLEDEGEEDEDADEAAEAVEPDAFLRAITYIEALTHYPIWGEHNIDLDRALEPQRATVLDLAGGGRKVVEYTAARMLSEIWQRALAGQLPHPVFVVLEEAHNLVPGHGARTRASAIINTIASEGRKFHVYLIVVTQRPSKINEETLSQCGSQIIMQITNGRDQQAIANAAESASSELVSDLAGLNRGEAVVLGQLTRIPAIINVSGRQSAEGGADIDLIEALERARATAGVRRDAEAAHADEPVRPARAREAEE